MAADNALVAGLLDASVDLVSEAVGVGGEEPLAALEASSVGGVGGTAVAGLVGVDLALALVEGVPVLT